MGMLYRDRIVTKSLRVGDRGNNVEVGKVIVDEEGKIVGFQTPVLLPEGTPVEPVAASVVLGSGDAAVEFTANVAGAAGNNISVEFIDSGTTNASLDVSVSDSKITVSLATDGTGTITSTANDVIGAVNGDAEASALVTASAPGAGTGVVSAQPETNLENGVDGTPGSKGALMFDSSNVYISVDVSTVSVSNWKKVALSALS